jgi:hypothetical protein
MWNETSEKALYHSSAFLTIIHRLGFPQGRIISQWFSKITAREAIQFLFTSGATVLEAL